MADWNLPATTTTYVNVLANLKDRDLDSAKLFDGVTVTNPATGMIRWSSANARLEKWNGTAWVALAATHAISISGSSASCTGNAATATALQTARTINGVSFNGTANITIPTSPPAPGTLSGTAIAWGTNAKWHATVSANTTFSFSSAPAVGTTCLLHVTHTAGTIAFPSTWVWPGNVAPSLTTGRVHLFAAYYDGAKYRASYLRNYPL